MAVSRRRVITVILVWHDSKTARFFLLFHSPRFIYLLLQMTWLKVVARLLRNRRRGIPQTCRTQTNRCRQGGWSSNERLVPQRLMLVVVLNNAHREENHRPWILNEKSIVKRAGIKRPTTLKRILPSFSSRPKCPSQGSKTIAIGKSQETAKETTSGSCGTSSGWWEQNVRLRKRPWVLPSRPWRKMDSRFHQHANGHLLCSSSSTSSSHHHQQ